MSPHRCRLLLAASLTLLIGSTASGQPPAAKSKPPRTDSRGDPLPEGAIGRIGPGRLRHAGSVHAVAFSPKGDLLASTGYDSRLRLWETGTGRPAGAFPLEFYLAAPLAFLPDGSVVTTSTGNTISILESGTGRERLRLTLPGKTAGALACSPDGKILAVGTDHIVRLWETTGGKEIRQLVGHQDYVSGVAFSPDGQLLLSGSSDGTIRLWRVATGEQIRAIDVCKPQGYGASSYGVGCVAFSPDGRTVAAGLRLMEYGQGEVTLWDASTGNRLRRLPGSDEEWTTYALAFSPDGKALAVAGYAKPVQLWDVHTAKRLQELQGCKARSVHFSPDGRTLATGDENGLVRLWDVASGKERPRAPGHVGMVWSMTFSHDGRKLAAHGADGTTRLWDVASGQQLVQLPLTPKDASHWRTCSSLAFLPDDRTLLAGDTDGSLGLWDAAKGKLLRRFAFEKTALWSFALSPDGGLSAAMTYLDPDLRLSFHETASGRQQRIMEIPLERNVSYLSAGRAAFTPDGKTVAARCNENIHLWDVQTGKYLRQLGEHNHPVADFAFSPDSKLLASCEVEALMNGSRRHEWILRKDVRLWDVATGKELLRILGRESDFSSIAFSPDGRTFAAANSRGVIRLWEVISGQQLLRYNTDEFRIGGIAFRPDGRGLATAVSDGTVLIWGLEPFGWQKPSALSATEAARLWQELGAADAALAYRAAWSLAAVPAVSVPFLTKHLKPVPALGPGDLARLIADLDHKEFRRREAATHELFRYRVQAEAAVRKALAEPVSEEVRRRIQLLLPKLQEEWLVTDAEELRSLRALWVLEKVANPEVRQILERLARGAREARLTQHAQATLSRLLKR